MTQSAAALGHEEVSEQLEAVANRADLLLDKYLAEVLLGGAELREPRELLGLAGGLAHLSAAFEARAVGTVNRCSVAACAAARARDGGAAEMPEAA